MNAKARAVGVLYLLMTAAGSIPMIVGRIPRSTGAATMAANLLAHPNLVYAGFLSDLLVVAFYLPVTVLLYELFERVDRTLSLTGAFFGLAGCVVQAFAALFRIAPLIVLHSMSPAAVPAYLVSQFYAPVYRIALVFFAFGLVINGALVYRSAFLPRLLGVLVMISGLGWMTCLWPPLATALWPRVILTLGIGEAALVLWLLIAGVKEPARV